MVYELWLWLKEIQQEDEKLFDKSFCVFMSLTEYYDDYCKLWVFSFYRATNFPLKYFIKYLALQDLFHYSSFVCSFFACSFVRSFGRFFGFLVCGSFVRSFVRLFVRSFVLSFGLSDSRSVGRLVVRLFIRSVVRLVGLSFFPSIGRSECWFCFTLFSTWTASFVRGGQHLASGFSFISTSPSTPWTTYCIISCEGQLIQF